MKGLRNTVLLPAGWEVRRCRSPATIGVYQGRAFVALINLNAENSYHVAITAKKGRSLRGVATRGRAARKDRHDVRRDVVQAVEPQLSEIRQPRHRRDAGVRDADDPVS